MLYPIPSCLLGFKGCLKRKQVQCTDHQSPGQTSPLEEFQGWGSLPVFAAVYVCLACQGRPWALQVHIHHKKLVYLRGILQHDHIMANLWDPQAQAQFYLPERQVDRWSSRCSIHWMFTDTMTKAETRDPPKRMGREQMPC